MPRTKKPVDNPATPQDESLGPDILVDDDGVQITPETHISLDGTYIPFEQPAGGPPREVTIGGRRYEHTDTDAFGIWNYRSF